MIGLFSFRNTNRGIDTDITNSGAIELGKLDGTHYIDLDRSVYASAKGNYDNYCGIVNKDLVGDSVGDSVPLNQHPNSA